MNIFYKLEKRFGRYAIPNLTYFLIGGQVLVFIINYLYPQYSNLFFLQGNLLLSGQWWRIFTFLFIPLSLNPLFAVFTWYIYYLYGTALEKHWGSFRYLIYILISYLGLVLLAFIFPYEILTNVYLFTSLFLAFAYLYPDFKLLIFFIIPVKIKWLAIIAWIGIGIAIVFGSFSTRITTIISIINFFLFFGKDLRTDLLLRMRSIPKRSSNFAKVEKAHHICGVCGRNEKDNPDMEIRYCSQCVPSICYCENHIQHHTHRKILG